MKLSRPANITRKSRVRLICLPNMSHTLLTNSLDNRLSDQDLFARRLWTATAINDNRSDTLILIIFEISYIK